MIVCIISPLIVNLILMFFKVKQSWDTLSNKNLTHTKNDQFQRLINIKPELAEILHNYHTLQEMKLTNLDKDNSHHLTCLN